VKRKPLGEVASVVRSKNAGPFELTLDVMFPDRASYDRVKSANALNAAMVAELYRVTRAEVLSATFFDPALAFKATLARRVSSGTAGDSDVFGCQQHAPLLDVLVPIGDD